jgi:hypothetical protein
VLDDQPHNAIYLYIGSCANHHIILSASTLAKDI